MSSAQPTFNANYEAQRAAREIFVDHELAAHRLSLQEAQERGLEDPFHYDYRLAVPLDHPVLQDQNLHAEGVDIYMPASPVDVVLAKFGLPIITTADGRRANFPSRTDRFTTGEDGDLVRLAQGERDQMRLTVTPDVPRDAYVLRSNDTDHNYPEVAILRAMRYRGKRLPAAFTPVVNGSAPNRRITTDPVRVFATANRIAGLIHTAREVGGKDIVYERRDAFRPSTDPWRAYRRAS